MTTNEFKMGMAIMSGSGLLPNLEPETGKIWKELLADLDFKYFRQACIQICKDHVDFYPGTNIPALIRQQAKDIKSKEFKEKNSWDKTFERYKLEAMKPEDAQKEARKFLEESGFKMKSLPYEK